MIEFNEREQEPGEEGDGLSVAVVGVGGAGANVLDRIALEGMTEAELLCMNTDIRALTNSVAATKVQLGKNLTQGLGAGGDPDLGLDAAKSSEEEIRGAVKGKDIVFVCGGLGGGTGSGSAPFIASVARSEGAFVVAFTTMPFSFEGRRRLAQAHSSLNHLRKSANALITFDNDRMGSLVLPKQGIQEAFAEADKIISQSVRAVIQLVTKPGLISIGMDDLITALDNDDSRCLFGYGQATGENRAQEALAKALKSPLLDKGEMLEEAQNVLVHICGGDSMTLFEVELLMKALEKEVSEKAQILFGVGSDPKLADKLSVTVISSMGKPLPPTAEDDTPKAAQTDSGSELEESEASQSSRSEVKPDQRAGRATAVPVAAAATALGASMLSAPVADAASSIPKARMSPIRRAMQPVEYTFDTPSEAGEPNPLEPGGDGLAAGRPASAPPSGSAMPEGGPGKGVISIFTEDDDDEEDNSSGKFDGGDDLDDDLDLMGDLGLDDDELDRLVAESAAVGLDDREAGEKQPSALDGDDLTSDLISDEMLDRVAEEELSPPDEIGDEREEIASAPEKSLIDNEIVPGEEPFDAADQSVDEEDPLDTAVVADTASADPPPSPALEEVDESISIAAAADADDEFPADVPEEDEIESFDDDDELEVIEGSEVTDVAATSGSEAAADPVEQVDADADVDESSEIAAAGVASIQANRSAELLKRVGLRRASADKPGATAERPQAAPQGKGRSPFGWSKPGASHQSAPEVASKQPVVADDTDEANDEANENGSRTRLPPPKSRQTVVAPTEPVAGQASPEEAPLESPFTPKGFVNKKSRSADQPRRGLPGKPTPLKLSKRASAPVEEVVEQQPSDAREPEQQTFDSSLEPQQKGRFDKGEPTVENGEDLDLPTFLRRKKG